MNSRLIITGTNATMPLDAAQQAWGQYRAKINAFVNAPFTVNTALPPARCTVCHGLGSIGTYRRIERDSEICPKCGC